MKKKMLSIIMLFAVTFCFVSGCNKNENNNKEEGVLVVNNKDVIAKINDTNYYADDLFEDLVNSNTNAEYIYGKLEDLLIKTVIPVSKYMEDKVNNEVEKLKKDAKENATVSGTSYKETLNTALEAEGVTSEEELVDKKIFDLQKEIFVNQYWQDEKENFYNGYLENRRPYHISQILVSMTTNSTDDDFNIEISESNAKKIYDIINSLINGEKFYNVARFSDDSNTKSKGGDMGVITLNDTNIVKEVRYALAAYSIFMEEANISYPDIFDDVYGSGIETIPEAQIDVLGDNYEDEDTYNITTAGGISLSSRVYTRNVIFNNLFNSRTFRFIQVNDEVNNKVELNNIRMPETDIVGFTTKSTQKVLTNGEGYPILIVKSDSGIHFISIEKSGYEEIDELKKYYSKQTDFTDAYTTYLERALNESDKESKLAILQSWANDYAIKKVSGNEDLAGNSEYLRYSRFKKYLNGTYNGIKFEITNELIKNVVLQFIDDQMNYTQTKINNVFGEGFLSLANYIEYEDSELNKKQIPILKCLDNKGCIYTYADGFKVVGGDE